jgi:hypothetical protein
MRHRPKLAISISIVGMAFLVLLAVYYNSSQVQANSLEQDPLLSNNLVLLQATGYITMLRVHDLGTGYGPGDDFLDGEVVIHLDSQGGNGFGFQLRNDDFRPAREGMLNLLRDAFNNNWIVTINYLIEPDKSNGVIVRAWLTKPEEIQDGEL